MNRADRRVRDLINPYSTAFASWWCHSAGKTSSFIVRSSHAASWASTENDGNATL